MQACAGMVIIRPGRIGATIGSCSASFAAGRCQRICPDRRHSRFRDCIFSLPIICMAGLLPRETYPRCWSSISAVTLKLLNPAGGEIFDLKELDLLRLRTLYDWLHPHFVAPRESGTEVLEAGCVLLASWLADLRHIDDIEPVDGTSDAANRVAQARYFYLREIIHNPSVEKISNLMGLSASQLRRSFAAAGEPPPLQVFRSIQLDYARRLLIGSSDPVSRVAEELGFGSLSSFTRAFTRHFGHSPLGVRRTGFNQR